MPGSIATRCLRSYDGTQLAYYVSGNPKGIPMVLCGGLGGSVRVWRSFFAGFGDQFRLLSWDYRGLYGSGRPPDPEAYAMTHHVGDLVHLLRHEKVDSPLLVGWSMGVQLGVELHRLHPELLRGFVAIHGTCGDPLTTAFDSSLTAVLVPYVLSLLRRVRGFGLVGPPLARSPLVVGTFVRLSQSLGLMAPTIDRAAFRDVAEGFTRLDLAVYAEIFERMAAHDASALLPSIRTPTLIIAGGADRFTPLQLSRRMVKAMPDASLEVIAEATHFGLLEFPDPIIESVERFARKRLGLNRTPTRHGRAPSRRGRGQRT